METYKFFKSAEKTARENGLIQSGKNLFDFSLLENMEISDAEKEYIKEHALINVNVAFPDQMYTKELDTYTCCNGEAIYYMYPVYSDGGCRHLYNVLKLYYIKHAHGSRKSVYDKYYHVTETFAGKEIQASYRDLRTEIYL